MTTESHTKTSRNATKATHTGGPWGIAKSHIDDVIAIRTDGEDDGQCLAQVLRDIGEEGEDEANAHLIAAAPSMLSALYEARDQLAQFVASDKEGRDADARKALREVRHAIAKATEGRTRT